jgi:TolB-like protein/cytochrome c-type biogenesis protein CcmH/NrfG
MTDPNKAVFLSYASQDANAAQQLCNALRAAGIEVWFDQSELRGGDAWDASIRRQIKTCALFLPVISWNTHHRDEGYFRLEWKLAVDRCHLMAADKAFLLPVAIDDTPDAEERVPERFREVQWTRLPAGANADAFVERVRRLLSPGATTPPAMNVRSSPPLPSSLAASSARPMLPLSRSFVPWIVGVALILAIGSIVTGKFWLSRRSAVESPTHAVAPTVVVFNPPARSIAVLPFVNMSGDTKQDYFSDGVSEELLNALAHINQLQVTARTSSFAFKGQNVDVSTIAHKLNVGSVLEGSVRRSGNTVRITAQLINAETGFHIWSQTYDRQLTDILKVQTQVATSVAQQLRITLVESDVAKVELGGTHNADAYDAFLRGKQIISGPNAHGATLRDALAAFDKAIALDPSFAKAHAERAWALHGIAVTVHNPDDRAALREQARAAAERAVALAPELGETHVALASVRAYALFDYVGAAPEFDRALSLSPGNATVQGAFAWYAADLGHFDQATSAARRAVSLDPQNARTLAVLGVVLSYARRYPEALAAYREFKALHPDSHAIGGNVAQTLLASGQVEQARQVCESPSAAMDEDDRHQCLALAYHFLGRQSDAERELNRYQALNGDSAAYAYAGVYSQWGNTAAALQWLTKAERLRDPWLWLLKIDWQLDPLRNEAQFKAIVDRMNFPP